MYLVMDKLLFAVAGEMLPSSPPAAAFTQPQVKQLRAQCLVFLAFRNHLEPRKVHLEIALGGCAQGETEIRAGGDGDTSSRCQSSSSYAARLPLPHLLPVSSLRLSSAPVTEQESRQHDDDDDEDRIVHDE
uniref:Uncharacterized protein n=1 Tax=Avena sativa TaxID=4498 RepID=A0ACD5WFR1_AVESA